MPNMIPDSDWLKHKQLIRRRYINEGTTLSDLLNELSSLKLTVSKSQLEYQLKKWEFFRNINKDAWTVIDQVIKKRLHDGKESDVIYCGKRVKQETVKKNTDRHRFIPTAAQPRPPSVPKSPINSQLTICTPPSLNIEFQWPDTLPWFVFREAEDPNLFATISQLHFEGMGTSLSSQIHYLDLTPNNGLPNYKPGSGQKASRLNRLAMEIGRWMPEYYIGQNLQRANTILSDQSQNKSGKEICHEYLDFAIFYISNNLTDLSYDFSRIVRFLRNYGALKIKGDLWKSGNLTIRSFMEKLFNAALLSYDEDGYNDDRKWKDNRNVLLKWLLSCGYPPNSPVISSDDGRDNRDVFLLSTPLQVAISRNDLKIVKHLLKSDANPNLTYPNGKRAQPLVMAVRNSKGSSYYDRDSGETLNRPDHYRLVELLLQKGASAGRDEALHLAIKLGNVKVVEAMIRHDSTLSGILRLSGGRIFDQGCAYDEVPDREWIDHLSTNPVYEETALAAAASKGPLETQMILDFIALRYSEIFIQNLITVDCFVAAAYARQPQVICLLYGAYMATRPPSLETEHHIIASSNLHGITPLHAAASTGDLDTCELLLRLNGSYPPHKREIISPLHLAASKNHKKIIQLFIDNGAKVNDASMVRIAKSGYNDYLHNLTTPYCYNTILLTPLQTLMTDVGGKEHEQASKILDCALFLLAQKEARLGGGEVAQAAAYSHSGLLKAALEAGGDANERLGEITALQLAVETGHSGNVKLLLNWGAKRVGAEVVSAASRGKSEIVEDLIRSGGSLREVDSRGVTVLEAAILHLRPNPIIERIFDSQPSIYEAGSLCAAALNKSKSVLQRLVANRPPCKTPSILEATAIWITSQYGDFDTLNMLLSMLENEVCPQEALLPVRKSSTDPYFEITGWLNKLSIMCVHEGRGYKGVERIPFWRGRDGQDYIKGSLLNMVTKDFGISHIPFKVFFMTMGRDPQYTPIKQKQKGEDCEPALRELLRRGCKPDRLTWDSIARQNTIYLARLLKSHNCSDGSLAKMTKPISNPLKSAIINENVEMVEILLAVGADVNEHYLENGNSTNNEDESNEKDLFDVSPLHGALKVGNKEIINLLLEHRATLNGSWHQPHQDKSATTFPLKENPLLPAIKSRDIDLVEKLLAVGADINEHNIDVKYGRSPLQLATELGDLDMLSYLLKARANPNAPPARYGGLTALQIASIKGYLGIASLLIHEYNANVRAKPAEKLGRTALDGAAEHGRLDMLEFLIRNGALDGEDRDSQLARAIGFAEIQAHNVAAELLRRYQIG